MRPADKDIKANPVPEGVVPDNAEMPNKESFYVMGTAGHIDHGKSTLVRYLTGVDPDRLAEEKRRGITIELGFAELVLPSGQRLGVVDVPGHERFVRHMVEGATGIDLALLVVAADDGVMVQTREHLAVLRLLGIQRLVVALSKIDRTDSESAELAALDVASLLEDTEYAGAEIVPVSGITGQGTKKLLAVLDKTVADLAKNTDDIDSDAAAATLGITRLPIDRVFTIHGAGTVITGTLWEGSVAAGDTLEVVPQRSGRGQQVRIRDVQVHDTNVARAYAGQRVALNLSGINKRDLRRGDALVTPGSMNASMSLKASISYGGFSEVAPSMAGTGDKPLRNGATLRLHHGTAETLARIRLINTRLLSAGQTAQAWLHLKEPLATRAGDRFILRSLSPAWTVGGGRILDSNPQVPIKQVSASKPAATSLAQREANTEQRAELVHKAVARIQTQGLTPEKTTDLAAELAADVKLLGFVLSQAVAQGELIRLGGEYHYTPEAIKQAQARVMDALTIHPQGLSTAELRDILGISRKYALLLLEYFDTRGITKRDGEVRVLK